jgi:hypothetical protein
MRFMTPAEIRKEAADRKAKRLLYAGGIPIIDSLIQKLSRYFLPSDDPKNPTSKEVEIYPGNIINADQIVGYARALEEDTSTLTEWADLTLDEMEKRYLERLNRRETIERRLRQIIAKSTSLDRFAKEGLFSGPGAGSVIIDFTQPSFIDFSRTTIDIIPAGGIEGNGEAVLPRNSAITRLVSLADALILSITAPPGSKSLSSPLNIFSDNPSKPFQVVIPGDGGGEIRLEIQLNKRADEVTLSGVEIEGLSECEIILEGSRDNASWSVLGKGKLASLGKTIFRFNRQPIKSIAIVLSSPKRTPGENGETVGIRRIRLFSGTYIDSGVFTTQALLGSAAPLSGVKITTISETPDSTSIDLMVSFTSADGPFIKTERIPSKAQGHEFTVWSPSSTRQLVEKIYPAQESENNAKFWVISTPSLDADKEIVNWDSELFVGTDQWFVESTKQNYEQLDYPYKIPSINEWDSFRIDRFNSGIFMEPYTAYTGPVTGDLTVDATPLIISGSLYGTYLLVKNDHSYGSGWNHENMVIIGCSEGINYLKPGREYRFTTFLHFTEETGIRISAITPGAGHSAGAITFTYCINGKPVLSAGEIQLEDATGYESFSSDVSFIAGWNKVEILVYRPNTSTEQNPDGRAVLLFSFDPTDKDYAEELQLSVMRARQESLTRVSEFSLRFLRNPGNRAAWAWIEDTNAILLNDRWGTSYTAAKFDGITAGVPANFTSSFRVGNSDETPGCWIKGFLRSSGESTPRVQSIRVDSI